MSTRPSCIVKRRLSLIFRRAGRRVLLLIGTAIVGLSLNACIGPGRGSRQPEETVPYELAWVEPKILLSDSLFTLIRAERLDSFVVAYSEASTRPATSLVFEISSSTCPTRIGLFEPSGGLLQMFVDQSLPRGFYKFKFDRLRYAAPLIDAPYYYLTAEHCGQTTTNKIHGQ
jgi:hypothetical protein